MSQLLSSLGTLLRPVRRLRRRVLLHRRSLAALTASGAVLAGLQATSPPDPATVQVWTARRDLASGVVLDRADLASSRLSPGTVPDAVVDRADHVVGHTLAAPMSRGEVFTDRRLLAPGLLRGYPGATAVPLRITDAGVVPLLRVGDRISLVVADPEGRSSPHLLVQDVPVVAIPETEQATSTTGAPGRLVIAAVPTSTASSVAAAAATSILIPVWNR